MYFILESISEYLKGEKSLPFMLTNHGDREERELENTSRI